LITTKTDKELLQLLKQGDKVAFYHIYERYCKRLYGFVLRYLKVEADADEIVQEVFVKIWDSRNKINMYASFDSFLFTIAYNSTISLLRKKANEKKYLEHIKSLQQIKQAPEVINEIAYNELNNQIISLLNKVTPRQREIFYLSRNEGLSHEEIANKLNITVNTVKKHMTNTLSFLKSNIDKGLLINMLFVSFFIS
jgi:RNA polymerase sigma-70 factor (ECF subfamily)